MGMTSMDPGTTRTRRTTTQTPMPTGMNPAESTVHERPRRFSFQESKPSFLTSEFWIYVASVIAVVITAKSIDGGNGANANDYMRADKALLYIVLLTMGYLLSRGLAKAGSRHSNDDY
jgi:hypothetical protein